MERKNSKVLSATIYKNNIRNQICLKPAVEGENKNRSMQKVMQLKLFILLCFSKALLPLLK